MRKIALLIPLCAVVALAACGGDDGDSCNLDDARPLAPSDWPMARHDPANTARIDAGAATVAADAIATCIFPGDAGAVADSVADCDEGGDAITTTVAVDTGRLVVATQVGEVRVLDFDGDEIDIERPINLFAAVNSPLLADDSSIYVTTTSGVVRRYDGFDGEQLFTSTFNDDVEVFPNIGPDGVLYAVSTVGTFGGVCTNGAFRFFRPLGAASVPAAVTANPDEPERTIVLATADTGRVQGLDDDRGELLWSFFTSGRLRRSAVVIDETRDIFVIADGQGQIFGASIRDGQPRLDGVDLIPHRAARCIPSLETCSTTADCADGETCMPETITASPALGGPASLPDRVYVASEGVLSETGATLSPGALYAFSLDFAGGGPDWTWTLPPGGSFLSSPVVVAGDFGDIVVFAADVACENADDADGACSAVGALREGAPGEAELLWLIELPDPVGTASPSVRRDRETDTAVIYIGTSAGKLYEIQ